MQELRVMLHPGDWQRELYLLAIKSCPTGKCSKQINQKVAIVDSYLYKYHAARSWSYATKGSIKEVFFKFPPNFLGWLEIVVRKETGAILSSFGQIKDLKSLCNSPRIASPKTFNYTDLLIQLIDNNNTEQKIQATNNFLKLRGLKLILHVSSYCQISRRLSIDSLRTPNRDYVWDRKFLSECFP